ncbi:hypothetical protein ACFODZ_00745 [Marinicella sediminis]|uniref:DUF2069 domain-containing protein n=1 Tax=Marinicella sediminis TaxID=1792834 RepID=A0ABV7J3Z7_9GAMM|nr:hypothetical protein [Marinicella sediminis]
MSDVRMLYRSAARWMLYCAALQITVSWVVGFHISTYQMLFFGLLGVLTAQGLHRGWRWLAWCSLFPVMMVSILAMARAFDATGLGIGWFAGIALTDCIVAVFLWRILWRSVER